MKVPDKDLFLSTVFVFVNGLTLVLLLLKLNDQVTVLNVIGILCIFIWLVVVSIVLTSFKN